MKHPFPALSAALLGCAAVDAQRLVAFDPLPATFFEVQPGGPFGPPSPPLAIYPTVPALPPGPVGAVPPGDSTFDNVAGINFFSNGVMVASSPTVNYPPAGPLLPAIPIGPGLMALLGGPVTGMAIDPFAGTLWLASAVGMCVGVAPLPGLPILVPAFPLAPGAAPITGLEWDGITGTLLALDIAGVVWPALPGGAPAGPAIVPVMPPPGVPTDVAIDKTGLLNGVGMRPLYVEVGGVTYDMTLPGAVVFPHGGGPTTLGLAFEPMPAESGPFGGCACGGLLPTVGATGPMTSGNLGYGLTVTGVMPLAPVVFGLDFVFTPAFPLLNATGCGVGLVLGSPTLITALLFAGPAGTATFPLALAVPPGFGPIFSQAFALCPADPAGFVVAEMQQTIACGG
ncbi:MAG: hypothetical protein KDE27_04645 [Planctomycetes bacterium]|nr:hypothetical protein [Planctomycetota bacterium]